MILAGLLTTVSGSRFKKIIMMEMSYEKEIARKGIIFALSLSLIEIFIGIPRNFSVTEIVVGLILLLILYVPGLIYFISLENKTLNKIIEKFYKSKKIKINEEAETVEDKVRRELSRTRSIKGGASWFDWIAVVSIIN